MRELIAGGRQYRVAAAGDRGAEQWERVSRLELASLLARWRRSSIDRDDLRGALLALHPFEAGGLDDDALVELARTRFEEGWWSLWRAPEPRLSNEAPQADGDGEPATNEAAIEQHFIRFTFEYPDGTPATGYDYRFTEPSGSTTDDTLPESGIIERQNVPADGTYCVELDEVESVSWEPSSIQCHQSATVIAQTLGLDDGTAVKIRLFRELEEKDDQAIASFDAVIEANAVRLEVSYDYLADDARKAEQELAWLIAEVFVDDNVWAKTLEPLVVQLKTLEAARWRSARVGPDQDAELVLVTHGYPVGTCAVVEIWTHHPVDGPVKLDRLPPVELDSDEVCVALRFAPSTDPAAPAIASHTIQQPGEYFARVFIDDDVHREALTRPIVCQ